MSSIRSRFNNKTAYKKYSDSNDDHTKIYKPFPTAYFIGILGLILLTFLLVIVIEKQLPKGIMIDEEEHYQDSFIAERAYTILKNLTKIGLMNSTV